MNNKSLPPVNNELLSACMDGEASSDEVQALLASAQSDEATRTTWMRYHVVRDYLQNEVAPDGIVSLAEKIATQIANEPAILAPTMLAAGSSAGVVKPTRMRWQSAVGLAVAASVFTVVLMSWQQMQSATPIAPLATSAGINVALPANAELAMPSTSNTVAVSDEEQQRLEELLLNHTEAMSANGLQVMLPYARVVSDRISLPVEDTGANNVPAATTESGSH